MLPKMPMFRPVTSAALVALLLAGCQARTETVDEEPIATEPTEGSSQSDEATAQGDEGPGDEGAGDEANGENSAADPAQAAAAIADQANPTPNGEQSMGAIVEASTDFAGDLWGEILAEHDGNALVSPASVFLAFLMTEAGANGATKEEMDDVLQLPPGPQHAAAGALASLLQNDEGPTVRISNRIWVEHSWLERLQPAFQSTLLEAYGAEAGTTSFLADPESARAEINDWVSEQTEAKITELLPEGSIDSLVRLVLTNTVYFHASWNTAFNVANTADAQFETPDGSVEVSMMSQSASFPFVENDSWLAVEVPYAGEDWSMIAVLPKDDAQVDLAAVPEAFANAQGELVALSFPRFTYRHAFSVAEPMQRLGMTSAFDSHTADFSNMATLGRDEGLYISRALHEAVVEFTETGTEAAAATAVVMSYRGGAIPAREYREVRFDRPFEFVIQHRETGTILFMGHVEDPTAE